MGIAAIKTMVVVTARRHPYIDFMKSSSDDYKIHVDLGISPWISYHHYYPCFGAFYYCNPYFIIKFQLFFVLVIIERRRICYYTIVDYNPLLGGGVVMMFTIRSLH